MLKVADQHLQRLPLFPLPSAFLFPRTLLPLHVFEPRYREMIAWCIGRRWPIAVARIEPGFERYAAGSPPLVPVAGIGEIVHHQKLEGGRYNIVVRGLARVSLTGEHPPTGPWRVARAELLPDVWPDDRPALDELVRTAHACLLRLRPHWTAIADSLGRSVHTSDPAHLADVLASTLFEDDSERQGLLECTDVALRLWTAVERLSLLVADTAPRDEPVQ